MPPTPEQETEFVAQYLKPSSIDHAKRLLERGEIPPGFVSVTAKWVSDQEREAEARKEASNAEQIELARSAAAEATRASAAAERSAVAAERQATAAERANTRATIALMIAIVSIIATVIGIWVTHMDIHK